jgi:putative component of membrane protein insertase Oxa1/YidC/SpoIIIJ protein YidD
MSYLKIFLSSSIKESDMLKKNGRMWSVLYTSSVALFAVILVVQLLQFLLSQSVCRNCVEIKSCSLIGYVTAAVQTAAHVCGRLHRVQFVTPNHERHMSVWRI